MGLLDRLSDSMRDALTPASDPANPSLAERIGLRSLSDDALRHELERRRRARGRPAHGRNAADDQLTAVSAARRDRLRDRTLAKCYVALELAPGASRSEVQRAFRSLLRQYHPDRNLDDAERHASAVALVSNLTDAYMAILAHLDRR